MVGQFDPRPTAAVTDAGASDGCTETARALHCRSRILLGLEEPPLKPVCQLPNNQEATRLGKRTRHLTRFLPYLSTRINPYFHSLVSGGAAFAGVVVAEAAATGHRHWRWPPCRGACFCRLGSLISISIERSRRFSDRPSKVFRSASCDSARALASTSRSPCSCVDQQRGHCWLASRASTSPSGSSCRPYAMIFTF